MEMACDRNGRSGVIGARSEWAEPPVRLSLLSSLIPCPTLLPKHETSINPTFYLFVILSPLEIQKLSFSLGVM
jgi:hypothetical protein